MLAAEALPLIFDGTSTPAPTTPTTSVGTTPTVLASETLERANISPTSTAIKLDIKTEQFGTIHAMYDSGASLNIIDAAWALKNFGAQVKTIKDFYCTTANGSIVISKYMRIRVCNTYGGSSFFAKFYLLRNSPHRFIMSRGMFWKLGYKLMRPDGEFIVQSQAEEDSGDLYDRIYKAIDYPLADETLLVDRDKCRDPAEFIQYLQGAQERWLQQDPLEQFDTRLESVLITAPWIVTQGTQVLHSLEADKAKRWHARQSAEEARRGLPELPTEISAQRTGLSKKQILEEAQKVHGTITSPTVKKQFYKLLVADGKRYAAHLADVGVLPNVEFEIKLTPNARPFHSRPYPLSYEKSLDSRRQLTELLAGGFIRVSESPWAAPYTMVPKPTRKGKREWRMAVDYRGLNKVTIKNRYPIPSMRDLYSKLRGARVFSCLDLRSGYHHVRIKREDQAKTAFITEYGLFEWTRMSFGFANAPSVFQRAMDAVFGDMEQVIVYIDDIVIATETEEEHMTVLLEVFRRLRKHSMTLRLIKCKFFQSSVKYLGMIVDADGVRCDDEYCRRVLTFTAPTSIKEVERYLGLIGWLGRFIPNLSKLTEKLTSMGKTTFEWSDDHQRHFDAIQRAVHAVKLLRHPDLARDFYVQTDASEKALGAVLLQDFGGPHLEPIEFISRKLTDCESRWHCSEQELVAVVYALNRWIKFLLPKPFVVFTDHKNLEILFKKGPGMKSRKLQRWIIQLQQFDFTAKYLPGKDNYIADFLSRDAEMLWNEMLLVSTIPAVASPAITASTTLELLWLPTVRTPSVQPINWNRLYSIPAHQATCLAIRRSSRLRDQPRVDYDEEKMYDLKQYGVKRTKAILELPRVYDDEAPLKSMASPPMNWSIKLGAARFRREFNKDSGIQSLLNAVTTGQGLADLPKDVRDEIAAGRYTAADGVLFRQGITAQHAVVVPVALQPDAVAYFHTARVFQHQGAARTYATMRQWYYWRGMKQAVYDYCTSCAVCRTTRIKRQELAKGRIKSIHASRPFEMISMDLVGPLPICSSGSRYLLTIMDRFTRYVAAIPLTNVTAATVSTAFVNEWILRYGPPDSVLADNGTQFTSVVLAITCKAIGTRQRFATIYHPECNGQIERWHRFLKERLTIRQKANALNFLKGDDWDIYIPSVVFSYNAAVHSITGYSPFQILYGRLPSLPLRLAKLTTLKVPQLRNYEDYLQFLTKTLGVIRNKVLQNTFLKSRALDKRNRDRSDFDFEVGELVYQRALGLKGNLASFSDKWLGPYEVLSRTENGAYQLRHVENPKDRPFVNGKYLTRLPAGCKPKRLKGRKTGN